MTEDEIINIITKSSFDELKKMRVDSDHISLVDLPDIYGAHQYFTIIDSKKKMDRYFGWHEGEFNGTYYGSPVKRSKEFWTDMQNFPSLTICVGVGTPRNMNISESNILMAINAKDNPKFFNASNSGGAKTKGHKSITALDNIVFNLGKNIFFYSALSDAHGKYAPRSPSTPQGLGKLSDKLVSQSGLLSGT